MEALVVLWAFIETEPIKIAHDSAPLRSSSQTAQIKHRFRMHGGIDCRTFFGELLAKSHGVRPSATSATDAGTPAVPRSADKREEPQSAPRVQPAPMPLKVTTPSSSTQQPAASRSNLAQRFIRMAAVSMIVGSAAVIACDVPLPRFLTNAPPIPGAQESDFVRDIEALRARNHVRELSASLEGAHLINMPTGTFGFAPAVMLGNLRGASIHRTPPVDSYELHRLRNGAHVLLGFASSPAAEMLERGTATAFEVSPIPTTTLKNLVMLPVERIRSAQIAQNDGQLSVKIDLAPAPPRSK